MKKDRRVAVLDCMFAIDQDKRIPFNGATRYAVNLHRLLAGLGYEPHVWQAGGTVHEYGGMRIEGLPWGEMEYGAQPELTLNFYERTAGFDKVVYLAPMLAFPRVRPQCVAISHGVFWDFPTQPFVNLTGPYKEEWLRRLFYAVTAPDLFVSVDTNMLNWIRATWPGYESRQVYIPNFVDTDLFHPTTKPPDGKTVVLYPRRVDTGRGIEEAKAAAAALTRKYRGLEFHFVGRAVTDDQEAGMRHWAEEHPGCRYYWVPLEEMPAVYREADIAVIPTKSCEGTSLACLEAMATGLPVICGRVGGLTDLIIDGYNGRSIDVTPETLTAAVESLVHDAGERRRLGEEARRTAEAFSLHRWQARWAEVLQQLWR